MHSGARPTGLPQLAWLAAALCALMLLLAGCGGGGRNLAEGPDAQLGGAPTGPAVKVAVLLPLSAPGNTASVAKAMKQAGELALFDFDNPNVTLLAKDTKGTPEGAKAAADAAVAEGAELIIGPLFSKEVAAAAPSARAAGIPMIAFSSDQSVAGNGVYLLSFLAGRDVPRIVSYTMSQGRRNFGALIPQTPYGQLVERAFRDAVSRQGGTIIAMERFPLDANGMLEPAKKVAELAKGEGRQIDALFIPAGSDVLPSVAALIPYFEIDTGQVKIIGTQEWDFPNVAREKSLVGGWFPAPDPQGWQSFAQNYVKTYESSPPRLASLAYDAVSLAVSLSRNRPGQRFTAAQLTRSSGFAGVDGLFRLQADGTSDRGLAVLEVQKFGTRAIDAAPASFGTAQF
ncbi:MAG: penicillin-binding protein activator [Pseudomonadota bacterium]|nr:penicillin-binding protein activator [Pseudomonadota bacterium]